MTKMLIDRAVVEQALNALSCIEYGMCGITDGPSDDTTMASMDALRAALAEPVEEPVGVVTSMVKGGVTWHRWPSDMPDGTTLYTAPPQRKPLAEWQITDLMADIDPEDMCSWTFRQGVYAAEKHHGIKP